MIKKPYNEMMIDERALQAAGIAVLKKREEEPGYVSAYDLAKAAVEAYLAAAGAK